ncbi:MAG: SsrA-binding protein SmpB [Gammaproteobacteria bacterium]
MTKKKTKDANKGSMIAENRRARFDYTLEAFFDAGVVLQGWEVKSIRAGKAGIADSYVIIKDNEAWLLGSQITPLLSASTHVVAQPNRTRKLLLNRKELNTLIGAVERKGYTLVPLKLHWKNGLVKLEFALGKGKKLHDKRDAAKEKEWRRDASKFKNVHKG